jgi:pyruvate kinase
MKKSSQPKIAVSKTSGSIVDVHSTGNGTAKKVEIDRLEKQVPANAAKYVSAAYKHAVKSGHRVLIVDGDRLVQVDAKNKKTLIHNVPPTVKIPKGTTYKLK